VPRWAAKRPQKSINNTASEHCPPFPCSLRDGAVPKQLTNSHRHSTKPEIGAVSVGAVVKWGMFWLHR
jgi:hypothetical protein